MASPSDDRSLSDERPSRDDRSLSDDRSSNSGRSSLSDRRRDAVLVVGLLAVLLGAGALADASLQPLVAFAGAVGTILLELLAYRRERRVKRLWTRAEVRAATVSIGLVVVLLGTWLAPNAAVSVGLGAGIAYLLLLGAVAVLDR